MIFFFLVLLHLCHCFIMEYVICMISSKLIVYMRSSMSKWPPNREIGIDCNKTSVRLRPLTMRPVAPRRAGAQLRSDAGGGNMWAHRVTVLSPHNPGKTLSACDIWWPLSAPAAVVVVVLRLTLWYSQRNNDQKCATCDTQCTVDCVDAVDFTLQNIALN